MAKKQKLELAPTIVTAQAGNEQGVEPGTKMVQGSNAGMVPAAPTKYGIGKLPRNGLHDGTKHGQGGTAGTYAAVVAALKVADGGMDLAAVKAVCVANGDPGFARYAVRNHWLLPITK